MLDLSKTKMIYEKLSDILDEFFEILAEKISLNSNIIIEGETLNYDEIDEKLSHQIAVCSIVKSLDAENIKKELNNMAIEIMENFPLNKKITFFIPDKPIFAPFHAQILSNKKMCISCSYASALGSKAISFSLFYVTKD